MKLLNRIKAAFKVFRSFEEYSEKEWLEFFNGPITKAGVHINEIKSLTLSSLFAAVNFISSVIASLPKGIYRELKAGGREKAKEHPLYDCLRKKPNSSKMSAWDFTYASVMHKYLWGNWYTYIDRNSYRNQELIPLLPHKTYIDLNNKNRYITEIDKKYIEIPSSKILHIPHITLNGITGKGIIYYARESLGIAKALDEFAGTYFGKGTNPGGFVEVEKKLDPVNRERIKEDFNNKYRGLGNLFNVVFLEGGAKFIQTEISPEKAQALQSRRFSVEEVSRWTNLPPHILRDLSRSTFNNIEHSGIELVVYSLLPLTTQIENAMDIAFFDEEERKDHFVKFELKGLLRGDIKARTEFYTAMIDRGIFNADNVLELEDMNPQENGLGKIYQVPLNMVNKEQLLQPVESMNEPDPPAGEPVIEDKTKRRLLLPEYRNGTLRRKTSIAFKSKFTEYGNKIVKAEVKALRKAIKESFSQKSISDFRSFIDSYYTDFKKELGDRAGPLISSYATSILPIVQDEINSDFDIHIQYEEFQRDFIRLLAKRHINSSKGQLLSLIKKAQEENEPIDEVLEQRLTEWEEKRPEKITMRELFRSESAFARVIFSLCGITKIMSVAMGSKVCPYCQDLDGKVIGIEESFLSAGEFQPEGADEPLTVTSNKTHPPYHDKCVCGIVASV